MTSAKTPTDGLFAQMRENYLRELPEKLNEIESLVLMVKRDRRALETLFRATHSLKGTAGTYGFAQISNICHNLEDSFAAFRGNQQQVDTEVVVDMWLLYVDLLRDTQAGLESGGGDEAHIQSALEALRRLYKPYEIRGLLVAESALDQAVVHKVFDSASVNLVDVNDGLVALERLLAEQFDFYVLGNQLPRLNGLSIIMAIRSNTGINRHTTSILMSSSTTQMSGRSTDPDYVVARDHRFAEQLTEVSRKMLPELLG